MAKKLKRFRQLRGKLRQEVIEMYRDAVERKAPVKEVEEFYDMADGYGGPVYFDEEGYEYNQYGEQL